MTGRQMRQALKKGRRVYGSCILNASAWSVSHYTQLDFAFIDNEHCPLGRESTMALCHVYKARGIVPVVRIRVADPALACQALDAGAEGIMCPYIEDPELLLEIGGAIRYRPLKGERLRTFLRDRMGVASVTLDYLNHRNRDNVLIANIESGPAIERLDELLAVDELDAVLIGPNDLSISLGIPEEYENPKFVTAAEDIIQQARAAGKGAGIHHLTRSESQERHYIQKGANLIVHSADVLEATRAIDDALRRLRKDFDEDLAEPAEGTLIGREGTSIAADGMTTPVDGSATKESPGTGMPPKEVRTADPDTSKTCII